MSREWRSSRAARRVWGQIVIGMVVLGSAATVQAQDPQEQARLVPVEQIPRRAESLMALESGDVVLLEPVADQRASRAMTRLIASGGVYQLDPVIFGNPSWASLRIDHVAQGEDQTLWAVGNDSVVYQRPGQVWELVQLPELSRNQCNRWGEFGVPCQMIVPISEGRAVVIRPVMSAGKLGTEVYAIEQGELRPLGSVVLPGVALGPAVQDGEGGFWVMLRRTEQTSNFKPMRGYLHYTVDGEWKMWSDSGESVEGTELVGKVKFLIDPNVRKMARDGKGGFYALGKDRVLYHVQRDGVASRLGAAQPSCQYCQPMAIAFDETTGDLSMLLGEWREGEAGQAEVMGPTRWLVFDGESGELEQDEVLPTPAQGVTNTREFFEQAVISSARQSRWLAAPGVLMHRERVGWALLVEPQVAEKQQEEARQQALVAARNPVKGKGAMVGALALVGVGVGGSMLVVNQGSTSENGFSVVYGTTAIGALAGFYPAMYTLPYLTPEKVGAPGRGLCLSVGLLTMTAANTAGVVLIGDAFAKASSGMADQQFRVHPMGVLGALGGATVGTMSGAWLTSVLYAHSEEAPNPLWTSFLLSAVSSSLASLGYFIASPAWGR